MTNLNSIIIEGNIIDKFIIDEKEVKLKIETKTKEREGIENHIFCVECFGHISRHAKELGISEKIRVLGYLANRNDEFMIIANHIDIAPFYNNL